MNLLIKTLSLEFNKSADKNIAAGQAAYMKHHFLFLGIKTPLRTALEKTMQEKEFFIRKAIGWVLREYSKTNPSAITEFIKKNRNTLSNLSITQASKYL